MSPIQRIYRKPIYDDVIITEEIRHPNGSKVYQYYKWYRVLERPENLVPIVIPTQRMVENIHKRLLLNMNHLLTMRFCNLTKLATRAQ